ncbi:MAG: flagellar assembly protein A [Campylobacter sp.]
MKEEKTDKNYLDPIILQTANPYNEILNLVKSFKVDAKFIDFRILDIITECKFIGETEPKILTQRELAIFNDDSVYVNNLDSINQNFRVEFFDIRKKRTNQLPEISISINKKLTKIIATIKKTSDISYFSEFETEIIDFINKKMLKVGIIVGIRNEIMKKELSKIASVLRVKEMLDRDFMFVVVNGVEAVMPIDDDLIFHYKNKIDNVDEYGKIDYSKRGYLLGVIQDEMIAEYIKPVEGKNGRDVRGNSIKVEPPKTAVTKIPEYTENIEQKEDEKSIKFFAKRAGYVKEEGGKLDIKDELDIKEISFKTTGSINTDLDSNITVNITEKDITKDAIGAGMNVEVNELNIEGNVAENTSIKANKLRIGGHTHSKAKIEARDAKIAVHLGSFDGDYVEIDRLEGGKVKAKNAVIKTVVGGEIVAQNLKIDTLGSNSNIKVANMLEIKQLKGTNNKIMVDFSMGSDRAENLAIYTAKIDDLKESTSKMPRQLEVRKIAIEENKMAVNLIKQRLEELKVAKIAPPVTFIKKLKEYQQLVNEYNSLLSEYKDNKAQIAELKERIVEMQNDVFEAKVVNYSSWNEFNEIKFKLIDPPKEITYNTRQNEIARVISLKKVEDENGDFDYVIKKSNDVKLV